MENFETILGWAYIFLTGLSMLNIAIIVLGSIVIMVFCGSASVSATIAEIRGHSIFKHFLGGLFLPIAYPIMINKKMIHIAKEHKSNKKELESDLRSEINTMMAKVQYEAECRKLVKKSLPIPDFIDWFNERKSTKETKASTKIAEDVITEKSDSGNLFEINRKFLESVAVDNSGNCQGPFQLVLSDGRQLTALHIKNITDDIASFEIIDNNGVIKNIRLKYANIATFKRIDE